MNRNCHGDFFKVEGVEYYACLGDSTIIRGVENGDECPSCERTIDTMKKHGTVGLEVEINRYVDLGHRRVNFELDGENFEV